MAYFASYGRIRLAYKKLMEDFVFNIEGFDIKLDTEKLGRNFVYIEEIDSTNSFLLSTKDYDENGTVILTEFQTKGRGRKDREWISDKEQNLLFSLLLTKNLNQEKINILNLGASLAVAQSIENLFQLDVSLKWPNDVLISGKKVAGILLESTSKGDKFDRVVVGIGINVNQANFTGKFLIHPTSIRREFKKSVSRERLLSEVLNNFEAIYNMWKVNPNKVLMDWKSRCKMLGEKIKIVEGDDIKYGTFDDVDENGYLLLKVNDEIEKIHFGDVSLR